MSTLLLPGVLFTAVMLHGPLQSQDQIVPERPGQSVSDPWTADRLIQPEALKKLLLNRQNAEVVIIHTGPPVLFKAGHIPGALSVGQTSDSSGGLKLREELRKIPKDKKIILYCGCCPWKNCPNVRPAYTLSRELGFRDVQALYLPTNFKIDWEKKGFPVEK